MATQQFPAKYVELPVISANYGRSLYYKNMALVGYLVLLAIQIYPYFTVHLYLTFWKYHSEVSFFEASVELQFLITICILIVLMRKGLWSKYTILYSILIVICSIGQLLLVGYTYNAYNLTYDMEVTIVKSHLLNLIISILLLVYCIWARRAYRHAVGK